MKRNLIAALVVVSMLLAACGSSDQSKEASSDSIHNDTVGAQAPGDSVRLADSAVNRADHVKVDTLKR